MREHSVDVLTSEDGVKALQRELITMQQRRIAAQQDIIASHDRAFRLLLQLTEAGGDVRAHLAQIVADADAVKV